jgi:two-component system response regulator AtoC
MRDAVHRKAISGAAIDFDCGENLRETMSEANKTRLLVVDDEQSIRRLCMTIGTTLGYVCAEAESAEAALARVESDAPDLILTDLKLPTMSGVELLKQSKQLLPHTEVAIMTGHGSIESAVDAMKLGAYDYIEKPFRVEKMRLLLQRMAEKVRLVTENEFLRERVTTEENLDGMIGTSANIQDVLRMISRLKDTRTPVLISGESGTGKELAARAIHFRGSMAQTPFVAVDCGSLVPTLMESELFGYEKGAFTGATKTKAGLFQAANGGTIFLDEIGELPLEMQAKLLRVLQEKEVRPVGSNSNVSVDVRVIAATNRDLEAAYRAGTFRKDLYFRLNVVTVHLPPLRERRSDIPVLVHHFLDRYAKGSQIQVTAGALNSFLHYDWPGNIRELENCIARAVTLGDGKTIDVIDLPPAIRSEQSDSAISASPESGSLSTTALAEMERMTILRVFEQANGDKALAGKMLGISRATLYRKLKRYNIHSRPGSLGGVLDPQEPAH